MATQLRETISAAKHGVESIKDAAEGALESAMGKMHYVKEEKAAAHKAATGLSTLVKAANLAVGAAMLFRTLEQARMLRYLGFRRRRSPLGALALVGAGAVAGAALVALFSPVSGGQTRDAVKRQIQKLGGKGKEAVHKVESQLKKLGEGEEERASAHM